MAKTSNLDDLDRHIIAALARNGRAPYREIARELGVSEGTIRNRVGRLTKEKLIRITAVGDMMALGVDVVATVNIRVNPGHVEKVAEMLVEYPNVRFVATSFGSVDIIIQVLNKDIQSLHDFVNQELPRLSSEITGTETFQLSRVLKSAWTWDDWFDL